MNSAYLSISSNFYCTPTSVLEHSLPILPENISRQLAILEYRRNEELISVNNLNPNDISSGENIELRLNDEDVVRLLEHAQNNITANMIDIDPDVRKYVDVNFLDLIWK